MKERAQLIVALALDALHAGFLGLNDVSAVGLGTGPHTGINAGSNYTGHTHP